MTLATSEQSNGKLEILKTDRIGRVQRSREEIDAILDSFEASAMSGAEFARQHGLNYPTFASWRARRRKEREQDKGEVSEFTFLEVTSGITAEEPTITIDLGTSMHLKIESETQTHLAADLISKIIKRTTLGNDA